MAVGVELCPIVNTDLDAAMDSDVETNSEMDLDVETDLVVDVDLAKYGEVQLRTTD